MRERRHLGHLGVDGRIILKWIFKKCDGGGGKDWNHLAQDRDRWRSLVSEVMNLRVPQNVENILTSRRPVNIPGRTLHHGFS